MRPFAREIYKCTRCCDAGFYHPRREDGTVDFGRTVECACQKEDNRRHRLIQLMRLCELPPESEGYTFEEFTNRPGLGEAKSMALEVADGKCKWLTLSGGPDLGKTHLAIAICRRWLARGVPAKYAYVPLLMDELRRGYGHDGEEAFEYRFKIYCTVPLLVLDDLGVERSTTWAQEKLDTIVDSRLMNDLSLVVTTNLAMDEINERLSSRLQRHGKVVFIDAGEYRLHKGER